MKTIILAVVASVVVIVAAFAYADIFFPNASAVIIAKTVTMVTSGPLVLGLLLGLLPQKMFRYGIVPWGFALISVGINWIFFSKAWFQVPENTIASLLMSFIILGLFAHLGVQVTQSIRGTIHSQPSPAPYSSPGAGSESGEA